MRTSSFVFLVFLLVFIVQAIAQVNRQTLPTLNAEAIKASRPIAEKAFVNFVNAAREGDVKELGFDSLAKARSATLGDPIPVMLVRLDKLQAYRDTTDPYSLLENVNRVIYPAAVKQRDLSTLEVEKVGDSWEVTALGGRELIKLFSTARAQAKAAQKALNITYFAVHVPALNLYFLGGSVLISSVSCSIFEDRRNYLIL